MVDLERGEVRHPARVPFPAFLRGLPPAQREVDPAAVMKAVSEVLDPGGVQGIVLCGQMHGFVLVDGQGEAISNYISWLDRRVQQREFEAMAALLSSREHAESGHELRPSIAVSILHSMRARAGTPVSIADYVAGRLCGTVPVMDPTQAAAFGCFHLGRMDWHRDVIGKLGLDHLHWPKIVPTGTVAGTWRGVPCYASVGDQQAALLGALLEPGELSVNIGTGSQVAMISSTIADDSNEAQTRPYFDGRFLRTITHIPGGRALSALVALMSELGSSTEAEAWLRIDAALSQTPATDLRAGLAFFPGPCGLGGFLENLHEGNLTIGHVFRAAYESMAGNYVALCVQAAGRCSVCTRGLLGRGGAALGCAAGDYGAGDGVALPVVAQCRGHVVRADGSGQEGHRWIH